MVPLLGLAPGGVCRAGLLPDSRCALTAPFHPCLIPLRGHRRFAFCCTVRRLTPPRRYLAPCPVEPGLSSARERDAAAWPASLWQCSSGAGIRDWRFGIGPSRSPGARLVRRISNPESRLHSYSSLREAPVIAAASL